MQTNSVFQVWYWHWVSQLQHKLYRRYLRKLCIKHLKPHYPEINKKNIWTDSQLLWEFKCCLHGVLGQQDHLDPAAKEMIEEVDQLIKAHPDTIDFESDWAQLKEQIEQQNNSYE